MGVQHRRILGSLERKENPSRVDFLLKYSIANPTARISELRQMGYPIQGMKCYTENNYGEVTHYFRYSMDFNKLPEHLKQEIAQ